MITEEKPVQILELFGGIGSPRCALRNLKIHYTTLYRQVGNSIAVPIFESIFRKIILGEERETK